MEMDGGSIRAKKTRRRVSEKGETPIYVVVATCSSRLPGDWCLLSREAAGSKIYRFPSRCLTESSGQREGGTQRRGDLLPPMRCGLRGRQVQHVPLVGVDIAGI